MIILNKKQKVTIDDNIVSGYAFLWGEDKEGDIILPESIEATLKRKKPTVFRYLHNFEIPVGKVIKWIPDDNGLGYQAKILTDFEKGKEIYSLIVNEIVNTVSIGAISTEREYLKDNKTLHKNVDIYEISLTEMPAREGTSAVAKSLELKAIANLFEKLGKR